MQVDIPYIHQQRRFNLVLCVVLQDAQFAAQRASVKPATKATLLTQQHFSAISLVANFLVLQALAAVRKLIPLSVFHVKPPISTANHSQMEHASRVQWLIVFLASTLPSTSALNARTTTHCPLITLRVFGAVVQILMGIFVHHALAQLAMPVLLDMLLRVELMDVPNVQELLFVSAAQLPILHFVPDV